MQKIDIDKYIPIKVRQRDDIHNVWYYTNWYLYIENMPLSELIELRKEFPESTHYIDSAINMRDISSSFSAKHDRECRREQKQARQRKRGRYK